MNPIHQEVIIIGAGAAGLMCAIEAAKRHKKVLILDKSNKPGKKILMSGGGRCNFTNIDTSPLQFSSHNPHFCKSALSRYTPKDFIDMVERHQIPYYEKTLGQLFCTEKSSRILDMLLAECAKYKVKIMLNQTIEQITQDHSSFSLKTTQEHYRCQSLVIATGGLSIPTLGASPFGYQIASQFGLKVYPTRAGLVPLTLHTQDKERYESLAGISIESSVRCNKQSFKENILFTHRGLSGPAILQISSYWQPGETIHCTLLPDADILALLLNAQETSGSAQLKKILTQWMAKRLVEILFEDNVLSKPIKQLNSTDLALIEKTLHSFSLKPNGTEGYRTAEVTLGGVDCDELCSKRFESKKVPGLFFIGEVIDVAGWLGGYNFQWAWSSGWAAGQVV